LRLRSPGERKRCEHSREVLDDDLPQPGDARQVQAAVHLPPGAGDQRLQLPIQGGRMLLGSLQQAEAELQAFVGDERGFKLLREQQRGLAERVDDGFFGSHCGQRVPPLTGARLQSSRL